MSVLFSPFGNQQFSASGTALAVGHKLYTYTAGSSSQLATYTDATGAVAQSNPIILNTLGMPTNGQVWLTSGLAYKLVWTDASDVVIKTEDNITGVTGAAAISQFIASGLTPTYVSATQFTLPGDQTSAFHVNRRLQTTNTGGTIYSTITASAYTTLTTVTVVNDSGVLDSGLSAVNYGLITSTNTSLPLIVAANIGSAQITAPKLSGAQTGSAPIYGVRAWVNFNGTGTVAINASGNVSSVTDNGTGDYTINFTTAMPTANYALMTGPSVIVGQAASYQLGLYTNGIGSAPLLKSTTQVRVASARETQVDAYDASVAIIC
jgi:hypothetical protein